jgi:hypothetical protein
LRSPGLLGHAIRGYIHPGAVVAIATVDEDLFARVLAEQGKKLREVFIMRAVTIPGKGDIGHQRRL